MRRLPALIGLALMLALPASRARSCLVAGETLWKLVARSDAMALVVPIEGHGKAVRFEVLELWKGSAPPTLELPAWLAGGCSSNEGAQGVLVFLRQASRRLEPVDAGESPAQAAPREWLVDSWDPLLPQALSGCPSPEDLEVLRDRIDEAQRVQASGDPAERRGYLVENLALRVTRADAAMELLQTAEPQSPSASEQLLVARGFLDEPTGDGGLPALLQFLDGYVDPLFERAALQAAEAGLATEEPDYWVWEALSLLLARHAPGASLDELIATGGDQEGADLRQTWTLARARYGLP